MEPLLTPDEVAAALRVSRYTVMTWAREGRIPAINIGPAKGRGVWRFRRSAIDKHLEGVTRG